jgi:hypothetical protein
MANVAEIEIFMYDNSCSIMNRCTGFGVRGARPHRDRTDTTPVDSKILVFML